MTTKTYDRNVLGGQALIANDDRTIVQYINIRRASTLITDISFVELKQLHSIAAGLVNRQVGGPKAEFSGEEWVRYAEGLQTRAADGQLS